ncbi:MAG: serine O-acetyltransferase EpsC [bacterium]|nr:serine acetyltransferase [bacterium]MBU1918160.1 serine acetyltransferase [bacterium]
MKKTNKKQTLPKNLTDVVNELCKQQKSILAKEASCSCSHPLPSSDTVEHIVTDLRSILFPFHFGLNDFGPDRHVTEMQSKLERLQPLLKEQILRGLCYDCRVNQKGDHKTCETQSDKITKQFLYFLPKIKELLSSDVSAAYNGDPAAASLDEAVFCYPGIHAMTNYRLAHELFILSVPLIPRMITEQAHSKTGIDIHPGATIGNNFFIDHGTGVVIGETCVIGNNVRLYQGVTLGAKSFPLDSEGNPVKGVARHPIVEDDVIIYSEATILGRVTIGKGSTIGGNVWLTHSTPPGSHVTQATAQEGKFDQGGGI